MDAHQALIFTSKVMKQRDKFPWEQIPKISYLLLLISIFDAFVMQIVNLDLIFQTKTQTEHAYAWRLRKKSISCKGKIKKPQTFFVTPHPVHTSCFTPTV